MSSQPKLSMSKQAIRRRKERMEIKTLRKQCAKAPSANGNKKKTRGSNNRSFSTQSKSESGEDILGVVTIKKESPVGLVLLRFVVNPRSLSDTRLGQYTTLWHRWTPKKLQIVVTSAAGKMVPGSYIVCWYADPSEVLLPKGEGNIRRMTSSGCCVQQPVGNSAVLNVPMKTSRKFYNFKGDDFDDSHGVIFAAVAGEAGATAVTLSIKLRWTILFDGPDLPLAVESLVAEPDSEWVPVFTDSVSDWAEGTRLTFKHREGGSVVPWSNLEAGVVYTPGKGCKFPYYNSSGQLAECKYFSKMLNTSLYSTALVCHASAADASSYQSTGKIDKVLPYNAQGPWTTPDNCYVIGQAINTAMLDLSPSGGRLLSRDVATTSAAQASLTSAAEVPRNPIASADGSDLDRIADLVVAKLLALRLRDTESPSSGFEVLDDPN